MTRQQLDDLVAFIIAAAFDASLNPDGKCREELLRDAAEKHDALYRAFGFDPDTEHS